VSSPRVGIIGPMLGSNPGWVVGQGEVVAGLLARDGVEVLSASCFPNRWLRLLDVATSPVRWRGRVDLLIVMVFSGPAFRLADAATAVAHRLDIPLALWLHGGNLTAFAEERPAWVDRVLGRGRAWVAPSGFLAGPFRDRGFDVRVIPNVVDLDEHPYRHRPEVAPRLLWMRTFHALYRPDLALHALALLRRTHPDATLTLAGQDKGLLGETRRLAMELELDEAVRFAGFLDAEGKRREFARHDVFLNTNRVDNAPVSVLEAAAFGLPVVSTDVGGIPHLLRHGEEALLVPEGDAEAMTEAVRRLLDEPGLAARLSAAGRAVAGRSAWPSVRPLWEALFRDLVR
jgi:L-malate glycosyltransferase